MHTYTYAHTHIRQGAGEEKERGPKNMYVHTLIYIHEYVHVQEEREAIRQRAVEEERERVE